MIQKFLQRAYRTTPTAYQLDPDKGHEGKDKKDQQGGGQAVTPHRHGLEYLHKGTERFNLSLEKDPEKQNGDYRHPNADARGHPAFSQKEEHPIQTMP
jgi:hypothetical protein